MNKQRLLKPVNTILAIDFICLIITVFLNDVLPRNVFSVVHPLFGFILFICVIFHVNLNWSWIKMNLLKKKSDKTT
jgi:L-asparagine transporter-like permease